ncbi:unnamed protein product [Gadus morhua 'NCC']
MKTVRDDGEVTGLTVRDDGEMPGAAVNRFTREEPPFEAQLTEQKGGEARPGSARSGAGPADHGEMEADNQVILFVILFVPLFMFADMLSAQQEVCPHVTNAAVLLAGAAGGGPGNERR